MRLTDIPAKHHEVALAWFKGETIQIGDYTGEWYDLDSVKPAFYEGATYRVKPQNTIKVRDGFVSIEDKVWWHCAEGRELVFVDDYLCNIQDYPYLYSINKPDYRVVSRVLYSYDPDF